MLTDLEYRVWTQYILSADDGGVMRMSGLTIQADNDALARRPLKAIEKALQALVDVKLVLTFDHQGRRYLCDPLWQQYQKVQWPRPTQNPMPPEDVLAKCAEETRVLLERILKRSRSDHGKGHRLEAKGNGNRLEARGYGTDDRFEQFWFVYPKKVGKDAARREWDKLAPDNDLSDLMISRVREQSASAQWLKDNGQFIPHPRTWLHQGRWKDEATEAPSISDRTAMLATATKEFLES